MMTLRPGNSPTNLPAQVPESAPATSDPLVHDAYRGYSVDQDEEGTREYAIPASGKSEGLIFMAIFWCAISFPLWISFLLGKMKSDIPPVAGFLFTSLFPAIGLGLLYAALRMKYATHRLVITRDQVLLERRLFGRKKVRVLHRAGIRAVEQQTFFTRNYQPVYGIEIRGAEGKLRFGSGMAEPDKAAMCAALSKLLVQPNAPTATVLTSGEPAVVVESPSRALQRSVSDGTLMLEWKNQGQGCSMAIALGALLIVGFFGVNWGARLRAFDGLGGMLFTVFSLLPLVLFALFLLWGLMELVKNAGLSTRIEAQASGIRHSVYRHGRLVEETHFAPEEILSCGAVPSWGSGRETGQQTWRGEVVTKERILPFGQGAEKREIDRAVADLRRILGQKPPLSAERA